MIPFLFIEIWLQFFFVSFLGFLDWLSELKCVPVVPELTPTKTTYSQCVFRQQCHLRLWTGGTNASDLSCHMREKIMNISMYEPFCKIKHCFISATEAPGGASVVRCRLMYFLFQVKAYCKWEGFTCSLKDTHRKYERPAKHHSF